MSEAVKKDEFASPYIKIPVHALLTHQESPVNVSVYFKGKYVEAIKQGNLIKCDFLAKLKKENGYCYIHESQNEQWKSWLKNRFNKEETSTNRDAGIEKRHLYKISEFIAHSKKGIYFIEDSSINQTYVSEADKLMRNVCNSQLLGWYYDKTYDNQPVFFHGSRLAYMMALFFQVYPILPSKDISTLLYFSIIHEIDGDPLKTNRVIAKETSEYIIKNKIVLPKEILILITQQDELFDGSGFPKKLKKDQINMLVRIFSLFNRYDHNRMKSGGTRRKKHQAAEEVMVKEKLVYDQDLWIYFWGFIDTLEIL